MSLFIWNISVKPMMVGDLLLVVQLNDGVEHNLEEWIQLGDADHDQATNGFGSKILKVFKLSGYLQ